MVRPMVHSTKHYVQKSLTTVLAGAVENVAIVAAVDVGAKNLPTEVEEGNSIKACYVEMWIRTNDTSAGTAISVLHKKSGDSTNPSAADCAALHDWDNKKNVLSTTMGLTNINTSQAVAIHRGWYKIPKSKQRFGLGDDLTLSIFAQALDQNICGFFTYKEYS